MSRKSSMSIALARVVVLAVLASLSVHRTFAADNGSPWGANYFPNVPLVTQDGKTVHFYADLLKGKMVVINFIYTKCRDSCPMETAKLAQVQRLLGDRVGRDVFFYSISIDPERDTPAELKEYADKFHATIVRLVTIFSLKWSPPNFTYTSLSSDNKFKAYCRRGSLVKEET